MTERIKKRSKAFFKEKLLKRKGTGSAPGTLAYTGQQLLDQVSITLYRYNADSLQVINNAGPDEVIAQKDRTDKAWIEIKGLHDIETLTSIWNAFGFHPLLQEDILNTSQRPKIEEYDEQLFIVTKMLTRENDMPFREQISIVLTDGVVFTFQESDREHFAPIGQRLEVKGKRLRNLGADYMTYAIFDLIIDHYLDSSLTLHDRMDEVEEVLWSSDDTDPIHEIHALRRDLIALRKAIIPLKDPARTLYSEEQKVITDETRLFLRDSYDHLQQTIESLDSQRDVLNGLHDLYQTRLSNKMNEVMKVLTIIATLFIPLTFVAGIYGMNFSHMPELNWEYGYPAVWGVMISLTLGMFWFFKRKGWW